MSEKTRDPAEWLDPATGARISVHTYKWTDGSSRRSVRTAGDIYYHEIPCSGTGEHMQDYSEILLVSEGGVIHRVNGEKQYLRAGSLCFIRPDDLHSFCADGENGSCGIVAVDFQLEIFLSMSIFFENDAFLHQLTASVLPPCFQLDPAETDELYARLLRLNNPSVPPLLRKIKLKILLASLYSRCFIDEANLLSESSVPDWLETLCREMRKTENIAGGLDRMCDLACRTHGHLCKSFKKYLGRTPTGFVNELRMTRAARMLCEQSDDVESISISLGFQSLSRFYKLFKTQYGVSPVAYRKLHRKT